MSAEWYLWAASRVVSGQVLLVVLARKCERFPLHEHEHARQELAIHPVGHAAVTRDRVAEIPARGRGRGDDDDEKVSFSRSLCSRVSLRRGYAESGLGTHLMLNARLKPEAKKPPNGATSDANVASTTACSWNGAHGIDVTWRRSYGR